MAAEIRPLNETLFRPRRPVNESVPAVTVRVQVGLWRLLWVWVTQRRLTLRPLSFWVNARLTLAGSLSVNEKTVPTGCLWL